MGQAIKQQELWPFSHPSILRGIKHYSTLHWLAQLFTNNPLFRYKDKLAFVLCLCCHRGIALKALHQRKNNIALSYRHSLKIFMKTVDQKAYLFYLFSLLFNDRNIKLNIFMVSRFSILFSFYIHG